jgi:hypothetical protein
MIWMSVFYLCLFYFYDEDKFIKEIDRCGMKIDKYNVKKIN